MTDITISIFGNKILLEILNEIKLFNKFKTKYYDDFDVCIINSEKENALAIFFVNKNNISLFKNKNIKNFPHLLIHESSDIKPFDIGEIIDNLKVPFSILQL